MARPIRRSAVSEPECIQTRSMAPETPLASLSSCALARRSKRSSSTFWRPFWGSEGLTWALVETSGRSPGAAMAGWSAKAGRAAAKRPARKSMRKPVLMGKS